MAASTKTSLCLTALFALPLVTSCGDMSASAIPSKKPTEVSKQEDHLDHTPGSLLKALDEAGRVKSANARSGSYCY